MTSEEEDTIFTLPTAPAGPWDHLSKNEQTWIELILFISNGSDPKVTPNRVRALRVLFDTT